MPLPNWPKLWERYDKHRKANVRSWASGEAKRYSMSPSGASQYNPVRFGTDVDVMQIEFACLEAGVVVRQRPSVIKLYADARILLPNEPNVIIGVCLGVETPFIHVEWSPSGAIHGRPASPEWLNRTYNLRVVI